MPYAKVCNKCQRIVLLDAKVCSDPECGGTEWTNLIITPFWDSIDPYEEEGQQREEQE